MPDIAAVDPHDDDAMRAWHDALSRGARAGRTAPLVAGYDAMVFTMRHPGPVRRRLPVAAREGDEVVGALLLELPLTDDTETAQVEIDVPVEHRRRGVATALWRHALEVAAGEDRTVLQTEVHVPAGHTEATWAGSRFAAAVGFVTEHVEDHLVLDLPAVLPDHPEATVLQWVGPCPEEHVAAYASLQTAMNADVPTGGMTRTAVEVTPERVRTSDARLAASYLTLVTMALVDGEPAGYTLMFSPHEDPDEVIQDDTLVLRAHRGHGLGSVLKAANLRLLAEHRPGARRVHTWTDPGNAPMQALNRRFGFAGVETLHEMERR